MARSWSLMLPAGELATAAGVSIFLFAALPRPPLPGPLAILPAADDAGVLGTRPSSMPKTSAAGLGVAITFLSLLTCA